MISTWWRRWVNSKSRPARSARGRRSRFQPRLESLEDRFVPAAPVIDVIPSQNVPVGKSLILPITGSDADGNPITYTFSSSNGTFATQTHNGNPFLRLTVQGFGVIEIELFQDLAPETVGFIRGLVDSEFYDGLIFHRVIPGFVIQGGDPQGTGGGGPGFQFDDEFNANAVFTGDGQMAMAKTTDDTNGSQFFLTIGPQRHLDFNHTVFGQVVRGFNVIAAIAAVPRDANDKPTTDVVITDAEIVENRTDAVLTVLANGAGSATITVTATDSNNETSVRTFTVNSQADTANSPPFLGPVANQLTPQGQAVTFNVNATDLENDTLTFSAVLQGASAASATVAVNGNSVTVTPNAGFTGALSLLVGVRQQGVAQPQDTQLITIGVGDQPITAQGAPLTGVESGELNTVVVATFTDTDPNGAAGNFTAVINWGDGTQNNGTVRVRAGGAFEVVGTNTYPQPGTFTVRVTITGNLGATAETTATATIADAALNATGVPVTGTRGVPLNNVLVATFLSADTSDPVSEFTAMINWGDGTPATAATVVRGTGSTINVTGTHTYASAGQFPIMVSITSSGGATVAANTTATISEIPAGVLQFSMANFTINEDALTAVITVNRSGGTAGLITVRFATSDGTAGAGADYNATDGTLTFNDGETSKTFTVTIRNDARNEEAETINLTLSNPTGGAGLGQQTTATLTINANDQPVAGNNITVIGVGPFVRVLDGETGAERFEITPFGKFVRGSVRVTTGDLDADGVLEVIVGAPRGEGSRVLVFDGETGAAFAGDVAELQAFGPNFRGGVFVAVGDVNGDGGDDIILGAGAGGRSRVRVLDGATGDELLDFRAYETFSNGVHVAAGDLDGDGDADIITAPGFGAKPRVRTWDGETGNPLPGDVGEFFAYKEGFRGGVYVAAGDVDGDGLDDIITSPSMFKNRIRIFSGEDASEIDNLEVFGAKFRGGVRVAVGDINGDGLADIIAGAGLHGNGQVRVFDGLTLEELDLFFSRASFEDGVYVGGNRSLV